MGGIDPLEITPERFYLSRRKFITGIGAVTGSLLLFGACDDPSGAPAVDGDAWCDSAVANVATDELGDSLTPCQSVINYNNFYEFTTEKEKVAAVARGFETSPWTLEVGGLVRNPGKFTVDELIDRYPPEERVYRMRCVEAWSMVIPWLGFPLASLLDAAEPTAEARYVRFETLHDPERMPGQKSRAYQWPYVEGLRLDEAMHPLTILATGLYGRRLLPQDGAPIRLVVPWKYGFKSIKSLVRIDLVEEMPVSLWMNTSPSEYGFYANVNPDVPHPRWPQSTERRIGELARRRTLPFNGYGNEVAHLYQGMDPSELY